MKLSAYIVRVDSGFAPNPFGRRCTLACCKPAVRRNAAPGDFIVGTGSERALRPADHLVYAMRVGEVLSLDDYWERFPSKRRSPRSDLPQRRRRLAPRFLRPLVRRARESARYLIEESSGRAKACRLSPVTNHLSFRDKPMSLFQNQDRTEVNPMRHSESTWDYLSRSARPEAEWVSGLMNQLFDDYPQPHRDALRSQLASTTEEQSIAAFFELIMHGKLRSRPRSAATRRY